MGMAVKGEFVQWWVFKAAPGSPPAALRSELHPRPVRVLQGPRERNRGACAPLQKLMFKYLLCVKSVNYRDWKASAK